MGLSLPSLPALACLGVGWPLSFITLTVVVICIPQDLHYVRCYFRYL
jgi:hypothetical protein